MRNGAGALLLRPRHHPAGAGQGGRGAGLRHVLRPRAHPHPGEADRGAPRHRRRVAARRPLHAHPRPVGLAGHRRRGHHAHRAVDRGRAAGRVRPDHAREGDRHPRPPLRRPGHDRRRLRLEHRRARGPPRPRGQAPHRAPRVRRGDARAVDPGGGVVRRRVRVVRAVLGLPQAGPGPHPADHRRRRRPQDLPVDRPARRRLDDHARPRTTSAARSRRSRPPGPRPAATASPTSGCSSPSGPTPTT